MLLSLIGWAAQATVASGGVGGPEFQVNVTMTSAQYYPSITSDAAGNFVVVWNSDFGSAVVTGRRFDPAGVAVGGELVRSASTSELVKSRSAAEDDDGDFFVALEVWEQSKSGSATTRVVDRRYDGDATPAGDELAISEHTTVEQLQPSVTASSNGDLVVVWLSDPPEDTGRGVYGRRFDSTGDPVGGDFHVNSFTSGYQFEPAVAIDPSGDFVVVWHSSLQDGSDSGVFGQHFDANGERLGGEFQVNSYTTGAQAYARVASLGSSTFVAVWNSEGQDGSLTGVFGRLLSIRVFSDGFESGDACEWTAASGGGCP